MQAYLRNDNSHLSIFKIKIRLIGFDTAEVISSTDLSNISFEITNITFSNGSIASEPIGDSMAYDNGKKG